MEIKLLEKNQNKVTFVLKGIDHVFANTLRRLMTVEVPTIAIDEVNFYKNSSPLYDEIVAHRLGLIPLKTDLKSYTLPEECSCKGEGCAKCKLNITLNCNGPCTVYSKDLKSQDPKIKPIYDDMPIVKLDKDQQLEFEATAKLGKGKEHIKFSPALVFFRSYPEIIIKKDINAAKCVKSCPKDLFEMKDKKITIKDVTKCDLCEACVEACGSDAIEIKGSDKDFIFEVEAWGQLSPKEIMDEALNILDEKLDEFSKQVKSL
ncbi:MAG: DNA-directed RNA polymerase subunit D [Candidatus Nanoarchaeia archaeon]|nr:DNA-directed RNA polymerase subunit D [Candidatus Nanoarchaeia archaeon]